MPHMFRAGGKSKSFGSFEAGLKAGYLPSYNDVAKQQKAEKEGTALAQPAPVAQTPEQPPKPPVEVKPDDPEKPAPVLEDEPSAAPKRPLPDMELGEVKAKAKELGLDPDQHHMTLRKQVEEALNDQSGSD